jgi:hypothetical protein
VFASWATFADVVDPFVVPVFESEDVQVYPVIVLPPVAGAVQVTTSVAVFNTEATVGAAGVAGTVVAVIDEEALDAADVPKEFVAVTVKVYAVFDCNPVTVIGDDADDPVNPPGEDVAV